jgi:hypothetical protein
VLLSSNGTLVERGNGSSLPNLFCRLSQCLGDAQWVPPRRWDSSSNAWAIDGSRILIPRATTGGLWLFFPRSTCKWVDHRMRWSSGRQAWGRSALQHYEPGAEPRRPLPPWWSLWSASWRAAHRLWDVPSNKCPFRALARRGLPTSVLGL